MNPVKLEPGAEVVRLKIKSMIPELSQQNPQNCAEPLKTEKNGNKTYGGDLLAEQISLISGQLPIPDPDVCESISIFAAETNFWVELGLAFTLLRSADNSWKRAEKRIPHSTF